MDVKHTYEELLRSLDTHKNADKEWFLSLLDDSKQEAFEREHLQAVMQMMRLVRIRPHKRKIDEAKACLAVIAANKNPTAEDVVRSQR